MALARFAAVAQVRADPRASHAHALADDPGLALLMGLTALPKATHLTSYSYRARRAASEMLLAGVTGRMRELGLATGAEGFNLDFHAIRHHGTDVRWRTLRPGPLATHPRGADVLRPRPRLPGDGLLKRRADQGEQAREVIAFADYWHQDRRHRSRPARVRLQTDDRHRLTIQCRTRLFDVPC